MDSIQVKAVGYQQEKQAIEHIRTEVFQIEQEVSSELEFDGKDATAEHFLAYLGDRPVGTTRIRSLDRDTAKIERLAVLKDYRQRGIARQLMLSALEKILQWNKDTAVVHAQAYIAKLYQQLGFKLVGEEFTEAGIPHVKMVKHL